MNAYGEMTWRTAREKAGVLARHNRPRAKRLGMTSVGRLLGDGKPLRLVLQAAGLALVLATLASLGGWG